MKSDSPIFVPPTKAIIESVATEAPIKSPWHFLIINLVLPLAVLAYGLIALLIQLGVLSLGAILAGASPIGIALLATVGILSLIALVAPWLQRAVLKTKATEAEQKPEFPRALLKPSTARNLTLDTRITLSAGAFALTAVIIALMIVNPAGAIVGGSVLELIQLNLIPLSLAASGGALLGAAVGAGWKRMAFSYAAKKGYLPIAASEEKLIPQRAWYLDVVHDVPLYVRLFAGIMAGVSVANFSAILLGVSLGALPFGGIALGIAVLAIGSPFLLKGVEKLLPEKWQRKNEAAELKPKARYWFDQSRTLEIPWYGRLFLGMATGLSLGSLFPPLILVLPLVTTSLALASPLLFHLAEPLLQELRASGWWKATPHGMISMDNAWYIRLFTGSVTASALSLAFVALGMGSGLALGLSMSVVFLALISPLLFVAIRALTAKSPFFQSLLNPQVEIAATQSHEKHLAYGQWYVRASLGAMLGGILATSLAFTGLPLLAPIITLAAICLLVVMPPMLRRLQVFIATRKRTDSSVTVDTVTTTEETPRSVGVADLVVHASPPSPRSPAGGAGFFQAAPPVPEAHPPVVAAANPVRLTPEQAAFNRLLEESKEDEAVQFLKEHPQFDPKYVDEHGYTPRFLAGMYGLSKVMWELGRLNARIFYLADGGDGGSANPFALATPRGCAFIKGIIDRNDEKAFEYAIKVWPLGAEFKTPYIEELPALSYMAKWGREKMIRLVIDWSKILREESKRRPEAALQRRPEHDELIEAGKPWPTMLIAAAGAGHLELVKYLLVQGAEKNYQCTSPEPITAYDAALKNGHTEIAALLQNPQPNLGR